MKPIHYLVVFLVLNQSTFSGTRFLVALYAVHQQASALVVGALVALFSAAAMVGAVAMGKLVDLRGTRIPVLTGTLLLASGVGLPLLWRDFAVLYVAAFLIGGAYFTVYIAISTLISKCGEPGERALNFSRMTLGTAVASGLGPMLTGLAIDHLGYAAALGLLALVPLLSLAVPLTGRLPQAGPAASVTREGKGGGSVLALLRDPHLLPVYVISTLFILSLDIFVVMTPLYGTQLKLSASQIGLVVGAFALAAFVARIAVVPLTRFYTPWQLLLMALALAAVSTAVFGLISSASLLVVCAFVIGFGQGFGAPMYTAALYAAAPPERASEAMGLRMSLGMSAQTLLPLAVGSLGSFMAAGPVFWATGLLLLGGVFMQRKQWHSKPVRNDTRAAGH